MPFDPAWPQNGQNIDADRFRGQFAGIIDLIGSGSGINAAQVDSSGTLPPGPPFAQAVVDAVNTLEPGEPATADVSFDVTNVHFTFSIPRGYDGSSGADGAPGEVSQQQLDDAINGTSANTNAVSTLDTPFADPDIEALREKVNELILNGRR